MARAALGSLLFLVVAPGVMAGLVPWMLTVCVRNPMYLAVTATILGQAMILGRMVLFAYAAVFLATIASFVRFYEQPALRRRFGADYEEYRRTVPGWVPRRPG